MGDAMRSMFIANRLAIFASALSFILSPLQSQEDLAPPLPTEEALFVRRILEFWKDKESDLIKIQIAQFFQEYPESEFKESLLVVLGDTFWGEGLYEEALETYSKITSESLQEKVLNNKLDALYQLLRFQEIESVLAPILKDPKNTGSPNEEVWLFLYAEALRYQSRNDPSEVGKHRINEAKSYFEMLGNSQYKQKVVEALAEIAVAQKNYREAAERYFYLAFELPHKREKMLYNSALAYSTVDPEKGLNLLDVVLMLDGELVEEVGIQKMRLLFEANQYEDVVAMADEFPRPGYSKQQFLFSYLLGRSHFAIGNYEHTVKLLEGILPETTQELSSDPKYMTILTTLTAASHHLNDLEKLERWVSIYSAAFPEDPSNAQILYIYALTLLNTDHFEKAKDKFFQIKQQYPSYEKMESVAFEYNMLLVQNREWGKARNALLDFIKNYPKSKHIQTALQHIANASYRQLETAEKEDEADDDLREQLVMDMRLVLESSENLPDKAKRRYHLKMAKTLFDMGRHKAALDILKTYTKDYPDDPDLYQAHLLMSVVYKEGLNDPQNFAFHAEQVLALKPQFPDKSRLRLNLFGAYLQLAKTVEELEAPLSGSRSKSPYSELAAEHLYQARMDNEPIRPENKLWLANFYYTQIQVLQDDYEPEPLDDPKLREWALRSASMFRDFLGLTDENAIPQLQSKKIHLENELFKLATVYAWLGDYGKQAVLLKGLQKQQNTFPDWQWGLKARTSYALANNYKNRGDYQMALRMFSDIIAEKSPDRYVDSASKLQHARLSFARIPEVRRRIDDREIVLVLKQLKDLQIRRSLPQEPLHLEAAIDYTRIRSLLEVPEKRDEQRLFLLDRVKEEFTSETDIISKEYAYSRRQNPERDRIVRAYLALIEGQIAELEAKKAIGQGLELQYQTNTSKARDLYLSILQDNDTSTKYLIQEAQKGLDNIGGENF